MVILDVIAINLAVIPAFLFAEVILTVGFLQFSVSPVFLILEDAQYRAGMPSAAGNSRNPFSIQFLGDEKATLAADVIVKNPFDYF